MLGKLIVAIELWRGKVLSLIQSSNGKTLITVDIMWFQICGTADISDV